MKRRETLSLRSAKSVCAKLCKDFKKLITNHDLIAVKKFVLEYLKRKPELLALSLNCRIAESSGAVKF